MRSKPVFMKISKACIQKTMYFTCLGSRPSEPIGTISCTLSHLTDIINCVELNFNRSRFFCLGDIRKKQKWCYIHAFSIIKTSTRSRHAVSTNNVLVTRMLIPVIIICKYPHYITTNEAPPPLASFPAMPQAGCAAVIVQF